MVEEIKYKQKNVAMESSRRKRDGPSAGIADGLDGNARREVCVDPYRFPRLASAENVCGEIAAQRHCGGGSE